MLRRRETQRRDGGRGREREQNLARLAQGMVFGFRGDTKHNGEREGEGERERERGRETQLHKRSGRIGTKHLGFVSPRIALQMINDYLFGVPGVIDDLLWPGSRGEPTS